MTVPPGTSSKPTPPSPLSHHNKFNNSLPSDTPSDRSTQQNFKQFDLNLTATQWEAIKKHIDTCKSFPSCSISYPQWWYELQPDARQCAIQLLVSQIVQNWDNSTAPARIERKRKRNPLSVNVKLSCGDCDGDLSCRQCDVRVKRSKEDTRSQMLNEFSLRGQVVSSSTKRSNSKGKHHHNVTTIRPSFPLTHKFRLEIASNKDDSDYAPTDDEYGEDGSSGDSSTGFEEIEEETNVQKDSHKTDLGSDDPIITSAPEVEVETTSDSLAIKDVHPDLLLLLDEDDPEDDELDDKVGGTSSNQVLLDVDKIPPDGPADEDQGDGEVEMVLAEAEKTPEPEVEFTLLDSDDEKVKTLKNLKSALSRGLEMEHKELRKHWNPAFEPSFRARKGLHPWQKLAVTFLHHCRDTFGYAILGDEMGVGKTIETLSFISGNIARALAEPTKAKRQVHFVICPLVLQANWTKEATQWFHTKDLRAKEWEEKEWTNDSDIRTVWIIKDTLLVETSPFWKCMKDMLDNGDVDILGIFADEAHIAWRSFTSTRARIFRKLIRISKFNVLITGTPFPLGPEADAAGVLQHCGGLFDDSGKWGKVKARAFARLVDGRHWNILAFRILIAPFYLRRTRKSTWYGRWVIDRTVIRPIPFELIPYPDLFSEQSALSKAKRTRTGRLNLTELMERADKQRFNAWTPIYEEILERWEGVNGNSKRQKIMEEVISERLKITKATGRMERFIALIKKIKRQGERFIIVSDRLFLLTLAYYVCKDLLKLKIGVLAGTKIFDQSTSDKAREQTVDGLNTGSLDGIVMTDRVGGCGHTLVGANHMAFLGSLYSQTGEDQAIGRICREGQKRVPKAYIIADRQFKGDRTAFEIKEGRAEEEAELSKRFKKKNGDFEAFKYVEELYLDDDRWKELRLAEWRAECEARVAVAKTAKEANKRGRMSEGHRSNPIVLDKPGFDPEQPIVVE